MRMAPGNIIRFGYSVPENILNQGASFLRRLEQEPEPPARDEGELTVTCLRDRRRDAWREADTIREYRKRAWKWRARFRALRDMACLKAITIPRTIPMT